MKVLDFTKDFDLFISRDGKKVYLTINGDQASETMIILTEDQAYQLFNKLDINLE